MDKADSWVRQLPEVTQHVGQCESADAGFKSKSTSLPIEPLKKLVGIFLGQSSLEQSLPSRRNFCLGDRDIPYPI